MSPGGRDDHNEQALGRGLGDVCEAEFEMTPTTEQNKAGKKVRSRKLGTAAAGNPERQEEARRGKTGLGSGGFGRTVSGGRFRVF